MSTPTYKDALRKALADLDAHDAETDAALWNQPQAIPNGFWHKRDDRRLHLVSCVFFASRELLRELDALEALKKERGE